MILIYSFKTKVVLTNFHRDVFPIHVPITMFCTLHGRHLSIWHWDDVRWHDLHNELYKDSTNLNYIMRRIDTVIFLLPVTNPIKGKVVPLFFFNWAPRHEGVLGEWEYSSTHSLTSALDGGKWSALRPGRFTSRERAPDTHWIGGWVGPRAVLDAVVKRKIPSPAGNRTL
jgi:hypothetical protein